MSVFAKTVSVASSSLGGLVIRLFSIAVLARILSPAEFGVVAMGLSIVLIASPLAQLDLRDALMQRRSISQQHVRMALLCAGVSTGFFGLLLVAGAPATETWFGIPGLAPVLIVLTLLLVTEVLGQIPQGLLIRAGGEKVVGRSELWGFVVGFLCLGIPAAWLGAGLWALVLANVVQFVVKYGLTLMRLLREPKASYLEEMPHLGRREVLADLFRNSVPGTATRAISGAMPQLDNIVVGAVLGARDLGFYSRGFNLVSAPINNLLGLTIRTTVFREFNVRQDDLARLSAAATRAVELGALAVMLLCALALALAPQIVGILLGPDWLPAIPVLQGLAVAMATRSTPRIAIALCRSQGDLYPALRMSVVMAGTLVALAYAGGRFYGLPGVVAGVILTNIIHWLWSLQVISGALNLPRAVLLRLNLRPALLATALGIAVWTSARWLTVLGLGDALASVLALMAGGLAVTAVLVAVPRAVLPPWLRKRLANLMRQRLAKGPAAGLIQAVASRISPKGADHD